MKPWQGKILNTETVTVSLICYISITVIINIYQQPDEFNELSDTEDLPDTTNIDSNDNDNSDDDDDDDDSEDGVSI